MAAACSRLGIGAEGGSLPGRSLGHTRVIHRKDSDQSAETIQSRRDLALLLKRLRQMRREGLASHELRQRVSSALSEAGSLARFVAVTDGEAQAYGFRITRQAADSL